MFGLVKQMEMFIALLSFSGSLATKQNSEPCITYSY